MAVEKKITPGKGVQYDILDLSPEILRSIANLL